MYAVWRCITAPTLWVAARDSHIPQWLEEAPEGDTTGQGLAGVRRRLAHIAGAELVVVDEAGHMLHHDQPAAVARAVEAFLLR